MVLYSKLLEAGTLGKPDSVKRQWGLCKYRMAGTCLDSGGYHGSPRLPSHETWKPAETSKIVPFFDSVCFCMSLDFSIFTLWNNEIQMLTEEQEKPYWKRLISSARIKRRLSAGFFAGAVAVLAPEKSLRTDERKIFRLIPTSCFCSQKKKCPPWKYPGWRMKSAKRWRNHQNHKKSRRSRPASPWIHLLPVEVVDLYPEGTTDGEGRFKDDFIEIGKEESSRLERVPAKVYILKTVRHKVIRKSDMEKYPEERQILIHPLPLVPVSKCMAGASVRRTLSSTSSCIISRSTVWYSSIANQESS